MQLLDGFAYSRRSHMLLASGCSDIDRASSYGTQEDLKAHNICNDQIILHADEVDGCENVLRRDSEFSQR